MVASGGCTAAAIANLGLTSLHLVDPNPAQIALTRLKLELLASAGKEERLVLLGHLPMKSDKRMVALEKRLRQLNISSSTLGPMELTSSLGPDFVGRVASVSPDPIEAGTTIPITVLGTGLLLSSVTFSNPDIQVGSIASNTPNTIDTTLDIPNPTTFGVTTLTVTAPGGIDSTTFTVNQPLPTISQLSSSVGPLAQQFPSKEPA